jgi:hypothetical protein
VGPAKPLIGRVSGAVLTTVKWPGRETDHSLVSSAEVKKEWSYNSIHGVHRNSCTLPLRKQLNSVAFTNVTRAPGFPWYLTADITKPRVATHPRYFLWWWVRPCTIWVSIAMRFMDFFVLWTNKLKKLRPIASRVLLAKSQVYWTSTPSHSGPSPSAERRYSDHGALGEIAKVF